MIGCSKMAGALRYRNTAAAIRSNHSGETMNSIRNPKLRRAIWGVTAGFAASVAGEAMAQATLEEIVVTARKREESVQDIPVVVTAFTADELARRGVSELEDIAAATPGLSFEDFSSSFSAAPVMRGLTQVNVSSEVQNVATFVDGIYIQRNYAVDISLADFQRIEVVKGPQSALYGQNAFAGAINYVLNKPGEQFDGYGEVTAGTDGRLDYKAAFGGPLIEGKLGLRGYYGHSEFDGTWKNEFPGLSAKDARLGWTDNETYSLVAVATPTDWLRLEGDLHARRAARRQPPGLERQQRRRTEHRQLRTAGRRHDAPDLHLRRDRRFARRLPDRRLDPSRRRDQPRARDAGLHQRDRLLPRAGGHRVQRLALADLPVWQGRLLGPGDQLPGRQRR